MFGKGYLLGVVTKFKWASCHMAATIFLGTMFKEEAHGDFDLRTMPGDSNLLNSALAICNFSGSRRRDFAKTGGVATDVDVMLNPMGRDFAKTGGVATDVDVMLNPMGRCWPHIPGA
jgi:hypothetical protein